MLAISEWLSIGSFTAFEVPFAYTNGSKPLLSQFSPK